MANPYDREYVTLPPVEDGDTVRVKYYSHRTQSTQAREGTVIDTHVNGFTLDTGRDDYATSVRQQAALTGPETNVNVSTVVKSDDHGYIHSTHLNKNATPDEVTIEVLE